MNHRTPSPRSRSARVRGVLAPVAVAAVVVSAVIGAAGPAAAAEGLGEQSPSGLSALDTLVIFVGIPALVVAVVFALVYGLSRNSEPRLREGQAWWAEPEYFSKDGAVPDSDATAPVTQDQPRTTDGGGSGARW